MPHWHREPDVLVIELKQLCRDGCLKLFLLGFDPMRNSLDSTASQAENLPRWKRPLTSRKGCPFFRWQREREAALVGPRLEVSLGMSPAWFGL
jgi:hypothetical protein